MKLCATAIALTCSMLAPAQALEVLDNPAAAAVHGPPPGRAPAPPAMPATGVPHSDLPEPAVFAMMLLGVLLIGWRASRDSSETFT